MQIDRLDDREVATVIAAVRDWQQKTMAEHRRANDQGGEFGGVDIVLPFGEFEALGPAEIDQLVIKLTKSRQN